MRGTGRRTINWTIGGRPPIKGRPPKATGSEGTATCSDSQVFGFSSRRSSTLHHADQPPALYPVSEVPGRNQLARAPCSPPSHNNNRAGSALVAPIINQWQLLRQMSMLLVLAHLQQPLRRSKFCFVRCGRRCNAWSASRACEEGERAYCQRSLLREA